LVKHLRELIKLGAKFIALKFVGLGFRGFNSALFVAADYVSAIGHRNGSRR
jgi:hypothetical protein